MKSFYLRTRGKHFLIPEFNEEGTNLFKRVRQSFKRPDKYGFKVRVSGRLSDGKIDFTRVPAAKVEQNLSQLVTSPHLMVVLSLLNINLKSFNQRLLK